MPRRPRILVDAGYYHVFTRGNDRKKIFHNKQDYKFFFKIISKYLNKFQINILNYCLMPNHIHFLIQAQKARELPKFMQAILQVYAGYFREKYNSVGFTFQNRYKSKFIDKESYLLECARYIERNPIRDKVVNDPLNYPWSSLSFYVGGKDTGIITTINPLYLSLAETEPKRQQIYKDYILQERVYEDIVDKALKIG
jgi:putative transposase